MLQLLFNELFHKIIFFWAQMMASLLHHKINKKRWVIVTQQKLGLDQVFISLTYLSGQIISDIQLK